MRGRPVASREAWSALEAIARAVAGFRSLVMKVLLLAFGTFRTWPLLARTRR